MVRTNDLVHKLPYPISFPLSKYLSTTNSDKSVENAKDAFEAMLSFIAYIAASELLAIGGFKPTIMRSFQHRSMGPLKSLIQNSLTRSGKRAIFVSSLKNIFDNHAKELENAIDEFNEHKHKKRSAERVNARVHLSCSEIFAMKFLKIKFLDILRRLTRRNSKKVILMAYSKAHMTVSHFVINIFTRESTSLQLVNRYCMT